MTLIDLYLDYQEKYTKIYGLKTIVFMQVGSFHEAYSTDNEGFKLKELEPILNTKFTRRDNNTNKPASRSNPYLLGFPSISTVKNVAILTEKGYTVVIFDQIINGDDIDRQLLGVFSPGTYISDRQLSDANYILSVYLVEEKQINSNNLLAIGLTLIDVSTGYSIIHEFYSSKNDDKFGLDELIRIIQTFRPVEIIIYYNMRVYNSENIKHIKSYLELDKLQHYFYVYYNKKGSDPINLLCEDSFKINIQNNLFSKVYGINYQSSMNKGQSPIEVLRLEKKPYSVLSLMIMLKYISEHNVQLLKNLSYPDIYIYNKHLILGNNAIEQLNIIDSNNLELYDRKIDSLLSVVNKTNTPMGKRFLKANLLNPLSQEDKQTIVKRYDMIETLLRDGMCKKIENELKKIQDVERLHRKMALEILVPYEFYRLDQFYQATSKIIKLIYKDPILGTLIDNTTIQSFLNFQIDYNKIFDVDKMVKYNNFVDIESSFFKKGVNPKIDQIQDNIDNVRIIIDSTIKCISDLLEMRGCKKTSKEKDLIIFDYNDRDNYFFSITKRREGILRSELSKHKNIAVKSSDKIIFNINKDNVVFKSLAKGKTKLFIEPLQEHTFNLTKQKTIIVKLIKRSFLENINKLYINSKQMLQKIVKFISEIDFLVSGAIVASQYFYCKPLIKSNDKIASYLSAKQLRHPIVERLCKDTEYIPNNIELGNIDDKNGILLFGLNSSGKSVLMKSIGLSIVLAQIGYYVPATEFVFEPYMALFARITGNDNLFKGLSSFALEMIELDAIIKRTEDNGQYTLIIGDEVCRGTEEISGRALIASSLIHLSEKKTSFIFSSHIHDLINIEEIRNLNNLRLFHLLIEYDEKNDCLIFNRRLTPGSGPSVYGLMVAKFLIKNNKFINTAELIKRRFTQNENITIDIPIKKSNYNKDLLITYCFLCYYFPKENNKELESHHIHFQKDCWKDGKIKEKPYLHKNRLSNLVVLCRKCHEKVHRNEIIINGYVDTSIGPILNYSTNLNKTIQNTIREITKLDDIINRKSLTSNCYK
uniref:DNA mismatch repair proteins mutS family domain-containing protein n=1 Tax=viral metagenome TaxID=1070528 RepID=A0A6C0LUJ2_9ZZZZ